MGVKTYASKEVDIIFAGIIFEGLADGTFVTASRDNPSVTSITGSDGEGARAMSADKSGTIVVTLLQTSATNALLMAMSKADENTNSATGAMMVKDGSGSFIALAETAWIEKPADGEFGRELTTREWTFKTDNLDLSGGGN